MNLCNFLRLWTRQNHYVLLCLDEDWRDMFNLVDEINDGKKSIVEIRDYTVAAYAPYLTLLDADCYMDKRWLDSEVTHFYIGDTALVIWVKEKNDLIRKD